MSARAFSPWTGFIFTPSAPISFPIHVYDLAHGIYALNREREARRSGVPAHWRTWESRRARCASYARMRREVRAARPTIPTPYSGQDWTILDMIKTHYPIQHIMLDVWP